MSNTLPEKATCNRTVMLAVTAMLATTALAGCSTKAAPLASVSANDAQTALVKGDTNTALSHAEQAVLAEPRNAAYRAMLGATYMEAGRFKSAATSFKDAMSLGDNSPRTALSYALAEIAAGDNAAALAVLDDWRDDIDPADLGLAFSLAGQPQRGVHILGNALRGGQSTPKVRQNLAYSYALQGDWRSARLMAAEDVPANQIDDRIGQWAQTANPEAYQQRVANLLEVPVTWDGGQPAQLALANSVGAEQLAAEASALATPKTQTAAASYELPPLGGELMPVNGPSTTVEPVKAAQAYAASPVAKPDSFEDAFAAKAPSGATLAEVTGNAVKFVSNPVVQKMPARLGASAPVRTAASSNSAPAAGDHLIQLGSFSSEAGAKRAWGIYAKDMPQLSKYQMVITKARVRGKTYFRVSAGGFDQRASAKSMCSTVKASGNGCITWAAATPLPGAVDLGVRMAAR